MQLPILLLPIAVVFVMGMAIVALGLVRVLRAGKSPGQERLAAGDQSGSQEQTDAKQQTGLGCPGLGCAIFFLLAAIIGGVFALDLTFRNLEQARASNAWPTAPGHIVSSGVREYEEWNRDKEEQWTYYAAQVTYAYTVNGVLYTGDRINFSTAVRWGDRAPADKIIARYLTGATVEVYYNPENPQEAVLEPGESMAVGLPLSLAIAAWSAAIGLMIVILRALFRWSSR